MLISFFGPAKYDNYDKVSVFWFMLAYMICISIGYIIGLKIKLKTVNTSTIIHDERVSQKDKDILPLLKVSILIALAGVSIEIIELLAKNPAVFRLSNIGINYIEVRQQLEISSGYTIGILIRFFTGFFRIIVMTVGLYNFKKVSKNYKIAIIIFYILTILVNGVAYGTQKVLGDMLIYGAIVALLKMRSISRKNRIKIFVTIILVGILFISYVVINQVQRYEQIGVDVFNYGEKTVNGVYYDSDNFIFKIFGYRYGFGLSALLTGYLSAGYYGLSLCLKLPFKWTYGIGSSYILSKFLNEYLGLPYFYLDTYLNRMELQYGRMGAKAWNTVFPWLASDLTFLGALLLFIPIGVVFAIAWRETIQYENPISIVMVATIVLGLIYVPCNNQLFIGIDGFISTWVIIFYWIFNHNKFNLKRGNGIC